MIKKLLTSSFFVAIAVFGFCNMQTMALAGDATPYESWFLGMTPLIVGILGFGIFLYSSNVTHKKYCFNELPTELPLYMRRIMEAKSNKNYSRVFSGKRISY